MSISTLSPVAKEGGTYVVTISFTDEDGAAVVPTAATWTLTDSAGEVVNSREDIEISALDSTVDVVLTGLDLPSNSHKLEELEFTLTATYNSDLGSGLSLVDKCIIPVEAI